MSSSGPGVAHCCVIITTLVQVLAIATLTDAYRVSVSGVSSGGFMAVQYHVAHSSSVFGCGVVAGGPYYCALGNAATATTACMTAPQLINVNQLVAITHTTYATTLAIDNPSKLKNDNVFLFSGGNDTIVYTGVVIKLQEYYAKLLAANNAITFIDNRIPAAHGMVTNFFGNQCNVYKSPYILNCDYDLAGDILQKVFAGIQDLNAASSNMTGTVVTIDQSSFIPFGYTPATAGLYRYGYAYVPHSCQWQKGTHCTMHVAFHGCLQTVNDIGMDFVRNTGYNFWADTNEMIILYPQAQSNALNPQGCWDWWGFTGTAYASKLGVQITTIDAILRSVL